MLKSVKLLSDEQLKLNANEDQNSYHDKKDNKDASSTSHSATLECTLDDKIASDIDEAAASLIYNVEISLDSLAACNIIEF